MDFTESETQAPDDLGFMEMSYNSPPPLAQECKSFKWKIQLIDGHGNIEDQMLTTRDVWKLQNRKVIVHFDEDSGQPDEDSGGLLGSWLGQLSSDVNLLPIDYGDWRNFPPHRKDTAWDIIQTKFWFDDPTTRHEYVIGVLGNRCKDFKGRLWRDNGRSTRTETLENRPSNVPEDQWRGLVYIRFSEKWKKMQERNTTSRRKHTMPHRCGRRSFARTRRQIKNETGKAPCRAELFIKTRKKSDGNFVSDEAKKRADELTVLLTQNPSTQVSNNVTACLDDEYSRVFGRERSGRVRCVGRGPTPSKLIKRCTAARSEAENIEVVQLKTQVTSLTTQLDSLTGIMQQLLSTRSNDPTTSWTAYANILNPPMSQRRNGEGEIENQNNSTENGNNSH